MSRTFFPMNDTTDELRHALARTDDTMTQVIRRAGSGIDPDFERRLDNHQRCLRILLGGPEADVASDAIHAAKRVMTAADPAAPLAMLTMARETLATLVRRRIALADRQAA
jgi:hypothetical protein